MNKENIFLDDSLLIAKGGERDCYLHPHDNTKVIKTLHKKDEHNNQNELEYSYMKYITKRKNINLSQVTDCYGYVNTNLGKGLVFDRVLDFDGTPSKSFRYLVAYNLISREEQENLLEDLNNYLEKNKILFHDNSMTNIFYKKLSENKSTLVIVDGLGAKRLGFKFWLYMNIPLYRNYKIKKQWHKLMFLYNKDITRIDNGTMPMHRL